MQYLIYRMTSFILIKRFFQKLVRLETRNSPLKIFPAKRRYNKFCCSTDFLSNSITFDQQRLTNVAKGHRLCCSARETIDDAVFTHPMARSNFELYTFVEGMFHGKSAFGTDGPPTRRITAMIAMNDKYSSRSYFNQLLYANSSRVSRSNL